MYELIISNGTLVDGTGAPAAHADLAVADGRVAAIGDLKAAPAAQRVDATGKVVCPGFIDTHTHSEISVLANPDAPAKIRQGVTTEVVGNCGFSAFPLDPATRETARDFSHPVLGHPEVEWDWLDLGGYFERLERQKCAVNVAALVGQGTLRNAVLGFDRRAPSPAELGRMQSLLEHAMDEGAFGLSTGLSYAPGMFADTAEVVELARVVSRRGGLYATHLRDQADRLEEAVEEALEIGRRAALPVLISHHKAAGERNWGKVKNTLAMLDRAHAAGTRTASDVYPYLSGMSTMLPVLPPWVLEGGVDEMLARLRDPNARKRIRRDFETGLPGWENKATVLGWDNVVISSLATSKNRDLAGLSVREAAKLRGKDELECLFDLLVEEDGRVGRRSIQCCEEDVLAVLTHSRTMIGSDGLDVDYPHPRQYGCFARVLGEYVRDKRALSLESAIHKMTGLSAGTFGFKDLGVLAPGKRADVVVFDASAIRDEGTYADPSRHPSGIEWVFVGGKAAVAEGKPTGVRNGQILRKA